MTELGDSRVRIEVRQGGRTLCTVEPDGDVVRVGRSAASDVCIEDPGVAGDHARLLVRDDAVLLEDLGTGAGTTVRRGSSALKLDSSTPRAMLRTGDVVELGRRDDGGAVAELWISVEPAPEPPRVVEMRPLATLPGGAEAPAGGDAVLRTLCELQRRIGAADSMDGVLTAVADAALVLVPRATHATMLLRDRGGGPNTDDGFVPVLARVRGPGGTGEAPREPIRVTRSVFRKVVRERAAVLAADAPSGELSSESLLGASIRSTLGVPLWKGEEIHGVLQVDNRAAPGMFTSKDVDAIAVLAANASLAVANADLIQRLEIAEEQLERENRFLRTRDRARRGGGTEIVGESPAITALLAQMAKVADTRASVLIEGETGTGKELVAALLHEKSRRRERLFVAQNCAALPEALLESELFGHKRGAFTGANEERKGLFELADGGTLFLDEVTEMPLALQAKLLRVLQEGELRPVGATQARHVDVRIVAATNRDVEAEVRAGRFREDLYYRLNVFPLRVPPLRERKGDVALLARHFLVRYAAELGKPVPGFAAGALELLSAHSWPGNVRELENEVQRLVIQVEPGAFVTEDLLSPRIRRVEGTVEKAGVTRGSLKQMVDQVERHLILEALREHDNNKTSAAKALGITREGLHKKLRQLGVG